MIGKSSQSHGLEIPDQRILFESNITPGKRVDLIINTDLQQGRVDVRSSEIVTVGQKGELYLAQPSPRIAKSMLGRKLEATFLSRQHQPDDQWLRVGYRAKIMGLQDGMAMEGGKQRDVLVLSAPKKLRRTTLRLHYRLEPPTDRDLRLFILPDRTKVSIVDISAEGLKFRHGRSLRFSGGTVVDMELVSDQTALKLEGEVIRSGTAGWTGLGTQAYTALKLYPPRDDCQAKLTSLLNSLLTYKLARQSAMGRLSGN